MDAWLDAIVNHYANAGVPLPERRYWMVGQSARDCEQAVIMVQQTFLGSPENPIEFVQCNGPRGVTFQFEVLRCTPTISPRGDIPQAVDIQESSVHPVIDMEIMLDLGEIFAPVGTPGIVITVNPIPPDGGLHGAVASYSVDLFHAAEAMI